jgi:hypothetical protein
MVLAVPGAQCLFSILQLALKVRLEEGTRLRLTYQVRAVLRDFRVFATNLQARLTRISELVPSMTPAAMGAQDAAGKGMGGVHFVSIPDGSVAPSFGERSSPGQSKIASSRMHTRPAPSPTSTLNWQRA